MVFLQPAGGTLLAPASSPVNTPRGAAAEAAARSLIGSLPQGHIAFSAQALQTNNRSNADISALEMMSFNRSGHVDMSAVPYHQHNNTTLQTYEATTKLHGHHTISSHNRVGGGVSRDNYHRSPSRSPNRTRLLANNATHRRSASATGIRPASANVAGGVNRSMNEVMRSLDGSIHTADGACCGYRDVAAHQAHKRVKGLFVTFCQNSMESQLANATRELACEKQQREVDYENYREKLAALVHENDKLKAEHKQMSDTVGHWEENQAAKIKEITVLKEEYEKRWRDEVELSAKLRVTTSEAVEEAEKLKREDGGKRYKMQELEQEIENLKATLGRAENQALDNAKRAKNVFDEKEAYRGKCEDLEKEVQRLRETLKSKEGVILGLERELGKANDKLSSIAFFRESFAGKKKKSFNAGAPGSPMAAAGGSGVKDRLYKRYFGRMGN